MRGALIHRFITLGFALLLSLFSNASIANSDRSEAPVDIEALTLSFFPEATVIGAKQTDIPVIPVYQLQELLGYVFESNDFVNIPGFSGNRINMLIAMDVHGQLVGNAVIEHQEPIFLHGLGDPPLQKFVQQFAGPSVNNRVRVDSKNKSLGISTPNTVYIDGISRATISAIVINDTILSSALKVARQTLEEFAVPANMEVRHDYVEQLNWEGLLKQGYVKQWTISQEQVEDALGGIPLDSFSDSSLDLSLGRIEIFYAYLNTPSIGQSLLGADAFSALFDGFTFSENEHALLVASSGFYSYIADNFRPGSTPERLSMNQNGLSIPLRDANIGIAEDSFVLNNSSLPHNIRLFKIKPQTGFNPGAKIQLQLNMGLRKNHLVKQDISFTDTYQLPNKLFIESTPELDSKPPLWVSIWKSRLVEICFVLTYLFLLSLIFIKQHWFSSLGRYFTFFRWGALSFTLFFLGYYSQGQLSVVNIFTLLTSLVSEFNLGVFLLDPVIFILWVFTFISLFLWGRGVFCGWLCPFGVLQEMSAWLAKRLSIKQWKVSPKLHSRLSKLKYVILLGLLGLSFYSLSLAESLSEIEPFKTAITMNFVRSLPFVVYGLLLLGLGLVINKFYCRYLCPLGAGLAVLGRFRIFELLTRRSECGQPCQTCRHACGVNAINTSGHIDYDECIQCLECVVIINDETRCSPQVVKLKRRLKTNAALTKA